MTKLENVEYDINVSDYQPKKMQNKFENRCDVGRTMVYHLSLS